MPNHIRNMTWGETWVIGGLIPGSSCHMSKFPWARHCKVITVRWNSEILYIWAGSQSFSSPLLSRAFSVWKWLRHVWSARKETPFTTALLSLWEFIIHTDWPHTWIHTQTYSMKTHAHINTKIHPHMHTLSFISTYCTHSIHTCSFFCSHEYW